MPVPMKARNSMAKYRNRRTSATSRAAAVVRRYLPASIGRGLNRRGVASKETGFVDLAAATYQFDTAAGATAITLLATVAQGASVNQRVGKKIVLKSLQCRGQIANKTTATVNDCALLIVYDKRPTGALPNVTDILQTAQAASMNNDANSGRFSILKRHDFMLLGNITGVIATQQMTERSGVSADFYLSLKGLPSVFKAAGTGAIGDIEEGALYLVCVGAVAAGAAAAEGFLNFRTRFVDV